MPLPPLLQSIVGWLRAGYPEGVPQRDYLPLFALLASQLTDVEVKEVGEELVNSSDPGSQQAVRDAIEMVTHSKPNDADVSRVRAHLAAGGWSLAHPSAG
jgi:uncharacterized protein DUF3349